MRIRPIVSVLIGASLVACSLPETTVQQSTQSEHPAISYFSATRSSESELLYHTLLAELAARRGQLEVAYEAYMKASTYTDNPELPERAARIAVFAKDWPKAVTAGERWRSVDEGAPEARHILAASHMRLKNESVALDELLAIIEAHPKGAELGMAVVYALLNHESNQVMTQSLARELSERYADSPAAQFNFARISANMSDKTSAMQALDSTLALQPQHTEAVLLRSQLMVEAGQSEQAFAELRAAVEQSPKNIALNLGYARLLVDAGQLETATTVMSQVYELAPNNGAVVLNLGLMALKSRRLTESKTYLTHLLEINQRTSDAHYYLGRIADSQRDYETAIDHYSKVNGGDMQLDSQTRITELLALLGHVDQARFRLQRLRELNPAEDQQIHFLMVENRILRETGSHQEALELLTTALESYPNNVDVLYARALAAEKVGHEDIFEQHMREVLKIEPDNARALNALGYFLADRSRELDEAERYIKQANQLNPTDPAIIDSLGWLSYRQGNYAEALRLLRKAYQLLFDPEIAAHLGEVLWVSGDRESANEVWDDALEQSPEDDLLQNVIERFRQ